MFTLIDLLTEDGFYIKLIDLINHSSSDLPPGT